MGRGIRPKVTGSSGVGSRHKALGTESGGRWPQGTQQGEMGKKIGR